MCMLCCMYFVPKLHGTTTVMNTALKYTESLEPLVCIRKYWFTLANFTTYHAFFLRFNNLNMGDEYYSRWKNFENYRISHTKRTRLSSVSFCFIYIHFNFNIRFEWFLYHRYLLTHWGGVTHICVRNLTIIGSDNGLSPGRRQDFIWTNVCLLSIGTSGTNFSEILIKIQIISLKKMHLKNYRLENGGHSVSASMC